MKICVHGFSKMAEPIITKFIPNLSLIKDQVWKEFGDDQPQGYQVTALGLKLLNQNFFKAKKQNFIKFISDNNLTKI